jgi:REP element-mobilizing transposase RayT
LIRHIFIDSTANPGYKQPMSGQLRFKLKPRFRHGGRRKNAGRKNRSGLKAHARRPRFSDREPLHVTLKVRPGLPSLRGKAAYDSLRHAAALARPRGLHIVHFAVLSNHLHLILDPPRGPLARVMQAFCISLARQLNSKLRRDGAVFLGRYDLHVLRTPSEVRNALAYVLTNESRHRQDATPVIRLDPYSSASRFHAWRALGIRPRLRESRWSEQGAANRVDELAREPRTWLLREGWRSASPARS